MFSSLKIGTKILIMLSAIAILAVGISGYVGYNIAQKSIEKESFSKLTAVREMKANQIEDYFQQISSQVITFSEDRMVIDAMKLFKTGFYNIESESGAANAEDLDLKLKKHYQEKFLPRLQPNLDRPVSVSSYWPQDIKTRILQHLYIVSNPYQTGAKHLLDQADDGSPYSRAHQKYHPIIRNYLEKFGYYDIFLVDNKSGHIVYSVFKEMDYGTSLLVGPYSQTNMAAAFRAAREASGKDFIELVDFQPYHPSYNDQASFIASPIYDGPEKIGVLLFQMPVNRINDIMTSKQNWLEVGLGFSGETYIVGEDFKIRNQSRFLIEDSGNYFRMAENMGIPQITIGKIRNFHSTIGLQEVRTQGTIAALSGKTGVQIFPDYRGVSVLSSFRPLNIQNTNWVIMSELDEAEAMARVYELRNSIVVCFIGLIVFIIIVAVFFSRTITHPLQELTLQAGQLAKGSMDIKIAIHGGDEIGDLAQSFVAMQNSIKQLIDELEETNQGQANAIVALSTPLIPLHDQIVVMPLVGTLDDDRIQRIRASLLEGVFDSKVKVAILDITGVPVFDARIATGLARVAQAVRLIGADVIITGMQPDVANHLVDLGLHLDGIVTQRSLQHGIVLAMSRIENS
ncbi:MAG: methyl-accepting chemotaxis protein [Candidatus Latescibacterota bacterium]|jgi:methyl-accepting chemotaxis protein